MQSLPHPSCKRAIQMVNDCRGYAKLRHGKDIDDIGNNTIHSNQLRAHVQVHGTLAEKAEESEAQTVKSILKKTVSE